MKTIIAGSRAFPENADAIEACIGHIPDLWMPITEVVSGTAGGADRAGERWAELKGLPIRRFPADWERYGKRAGILRNRQMAEYADLLIAFWDGKSKGTHNMIETMKSLGKPVVLQKF